MLGMTRVEKGWEIYDKFLENFPETFNVNFSWGVLGIFKSQQLNKHIIFSFFIFYKLTIGQVDCFMTMNYQD